MSNTGTDLQHIGCQDNLAIADACDESKMFHQF
jgi:hypothetical protein